MSEKKPAKKRQPIASGMVWVKSGDVFNLVPDPDAPPLTVGLSPVTGGIGHDIYLALRAERKRQREQREQAKAERQRLAFEAKATAKANKEAELDKAIEKLFNDVHGAHSWDAVNISLWLVEHLDSFPSKKLPWNVGKGYRKYAYLQDQIRAALKRRGR